MREQLLYSNAPILVAFSGGKDSVAMVLLLLNWGIPKHRIHLHHHDVDGGGEDLFDWKCTKTYCQAFADHFGLKIFFSYRKGGIARAIYRREEPRQDVYFQTVPGGPYHIARADQTKINTRLKFPAVAADLQTRWCSGEVKIDVLKTAIAHNPAYLGEIFILTGERREESPKREKYQEIELHGTNAKKRKALQLRPVLDWTEDQVWEIIADYRVQPHPAYMLGWSRCSCQLCIFNDPNIWASIDKITPAKVTRIARMEDDLGFTLYSKQTIMDRVNKGKAFIMDEYWIEQAIGEFTAPIITAMWEIPAGAYKKEKSGSV